MQRHVAEADKRFIGGVSRQRWLGKKLRDRHTYWLRFLCTNNRLLSDCLQRVPLNLSAMLVPICLQRGSAILSSTFGPGLVLPERNGELCMR
jgi:hypothetical protein